MDKWGLFVTEDELKNMTRLVKQEGFDIFEVRKLTFVEMLTYIGNDVRLLTNCPHVIMFNATEEAYKNFINKYGLTGLF